MATHESHRVGIETKVNNDRSNETIRGLMMLPPSTRNPFRNNPPPSLIELIEIDSYVSLGEMNVICSECSALMWEEVNILLF